jgi:ABC-2 type transport system ATP-binding protein
LIEIADLHKSYDGVKALDGLTLRIDQGELFGLIGPNGAGKSTLLKSLVGLVKPEKGSIQINGKDLMTDAHSAKAMIGYAPEQAVLYEYLSGREFLEFIGGLRGIDKNLLAERIEVFLDTFDLQIKANELIADYSHGMRQKISLSAALLPETDILLLDEPTNGLDPESAFRFKKILQMRCAKGATIIFSSHVLDTVEKICSRVGIIHCGKMIACDSVAGLREIGGKQKSLEEVFMSILQTT